MKLATLASLLHPHFKVFPIEIGNGTPQTLHADTIIVDVNLRNVQTINDVKAMIPSFRHVRKRVFIVDKDVKTSVVQAYTLGATSIVFNPIDQKSLLKKLLFMDGSPATVIATADPVVHASLDGASAFASIFAAVLDGTDVDMRKIEGASLRISDSVSEAGLSSWLDTVRQHHEGTFQHCLMVTGVAVDFGHHIGFSKADIQRLTIAAMLHDIGKARIPLAILDKPGALDNKERAIMQTHPVIGFDAVAKMTNISAEVSDVVRHHHEYLDGSGYPDGLAGAQITDLVRVTTISDIFSALIEDRRYKPPMSRQRAYDILCDMKGKLEPPLVDAFKEVALTR